MLRPEYRDEEYESYFGITNEDENIGKGSRELTLAEVWDNTVIKRRGSEGDKEELWYSKNKAYWEGIEASVDGVLGGFDFVNENDLHDSLAFLDANLMTIEAANGKSAHEMRVIDFGAGIGRVTEGVLLQRFRKVDLVEPVEKFLEGARERIKKHFKGADKQCTFHCAGVQDFDSKDVVYDLAWFQWVLDYISDEDIVRTLERMKDLKVIVVKENAYNGGQDFILDLIDTALVRSERYLDFLISRAGFELVDKAFQRNFPDDLYPVPIKLFIRKQ